ncbi:MAG: hypothetical protein EHM49_01720 [Deltaproteobacteria bacterium]|nr:MAG: hypothetical protein EHM49_01720 [Deltaproteobacteria bacterium]
MNETISSSSWPNRISPDYIPAVALFTSCGTPLLEIELLQPSLLNGAILSSDSSSRCESLPGEIKIWQQNRIEKIKLLRGKYRSLLTPSLKFALQKDNEIEIETI